MYNKYNNIVRMWPSSWINTLRILLEDDHASVRSSLKEMKLDYLQNISKSFVHSCEFSSILIARSRDSSEFFKKNKRVD